MYISFEELSKTARIWIYQTNRPLTEQEQSKVSELSSSFLKEWAAHGASLKSSFKVSHDRFLIIGVDEEYNQASGCSIDASVALIKKISAEINVDFFDRSKICFMAENEIFDLPMMEVKKNVTTGRIKANTLTFNNLVSNVDDLEKNWVVESQNSWLKKYF